MSKKYKVPDYICVIKAIGIKYGNIQTHGHGVMR